MTFMDYLNEQLKDPEFAKAYASISAEEDLKLRITLEHSLATTFVELQRERDPLERQGKWMECLRLSKELERLNENDTKHTNEPG